MRILVISDIHANLTALEVVLGDAGQVDATWCLGDLVGYGPDPNECVDRVKALPGLRCVRGNHDAAALNQLDSSSFNIEARQALIWTQKTLSDSSREFLSAQPEKVFEGDVTLTHGSPRHPVWEYLLDTYTATLSFQFFTTPFCFIGHTHMPSRFTLLEGQTLARLSVPEVNHQIILPHRTIINPGSVGQPRDHDPRAAYAIFNSQTAEWDYRRVAYDIPAVQERMRVARLPERHILRLEGGW